MVYRPTVRMDDIYREYVELLYQQSNLDRNQIIRLALFSAPFSGVFQKQMEKHLQQGIDRCPAPPWTLRDHDVWQDAEIYGSWRERMLDNFTDVKLRLTDGKQQEHV